jgi:hypothetical protein
MSVAVLVVREGQIKTPTPFLETFTAYVCSVAPNSTPSREGAPAGGGPPAGMTVDMLLSLNVGHSRSKLKLSIKGLLWRGKEG